IGRVRESTIRTNNFLTLANAIVDGHDHGDLRCQIVRFAHIGFVRVVLLIGVVKAESGDGGAQHFHRGGRGRETTQHVYDALVERAGESELGSKLTKLQLVRQNAVPKQVRGFLKRGVLSQFVNIDTAIRQHSSVSVDPADTRVGGYDSFKALSSNSSRH